MPDSEVPLVAIKNLLTAITFFLTTTSSQYLGLVTLISIEVADSQHRYIESVTYLDLMILSNRIKMIASLILVAQGTSSSLGLVQ